MHYEVKIRLSTGERFGGCKIKAENIRQHKEENKRKSKKTTSISVYNNRKKENYE